jgi:hypothetical protein
LREFIVAVVVIIIITTTITITIIIIWTLRGFSFYICYSSLYCDMDENGIKHLVLCRVIMGKMELLRPSNDQCCSSGYEYDNGVDDIQSPEHYVVWNMNINTHIYPEFVVSFKAPLDVEGEVMFL